MFKVVCRLIAFDGDTENFPCHFHYEIGDEITYDGVYFTGRICQGLFPTMFPVVHNVHLMGNRYPAGIAFKYRALDVANPEMKKYDGVGFSPRKELPDRVPPSMRTLHPSAKKDKIRGMRFGCLDTRTLAQFSCEAVDLSDADYCQPFYRRAISILDRIAADPGIGAEGIMEKFTAFEREEISPVLTTPFIQVMLNGLEDVGYIELRPGGLAYPTGKEPPSRPTIG
ncbi:MAG TPA: hypothetical protein VHO84_03695 [Syntrophorhabdaceae bacterium]|nr:hypothetical protein [Syntrophorhabdaceae bacterium]